MGIRHQNAIAFRSVSCGSSCIPGNDIRFTPRTSSNIQSGRHGAELYTPLVQRLKILQQTLKIRLFSPPTPMPDDLILVDRSEYLLRKPILPK